jgi:hypothetical protein
MTMLRVGLIAMLLLAAAAAADTVTLRGTSIPLPGCEIQDIRHGRLYFTDGRGRRQWRELDHIVALGFERLSELDEAERLLTRNDTEAALGRFLAAMLKAETELEKLWVRVRLAQVHDSRGEYVQAAGHAAAVFVLRDEPYWRRLEPVSRPDRPGYPAAREARTLLQQAKREVKSPQLVAVVDRLIEIVEPIHDGLAEEDEGAPPEEGATISGFPIEQIRSGRLVIAGERARDEESPASRGAGAEGRSPPAAGRDGPPPEAPAGDSAEAIDALLAAGRTADAFVLCRRIAENPGNRSLGRFLHQYGRCLVELGRQKDAAVMFMRSALLYDSSPDAAPSLVETAVIYRDVYRNRSAARRLAERAREIAAGQGDSQTVQRARDILSSLDGGPVAREGP